MANAGFGLPFDASFVRSSASTPLRPWANILNDQPGLVVSVPIANAGGVSFDIDIDNSEEISFMAFVGSNFSGLFGADAYTSDANRIADTDPLVLFANLNHGTVRTGLIKHFKTFTATSRKFIRVFWVNTSGATRDMQFWRFLVGKWISPADNIEVGAQSRIDDRQIRRYGINGNRNFTPVGIYPAFSGKWPWINPTEFQNFIKPMMLTYGASKPVLFHLNYDDTVRGEDDMYYGDLEKDQAIAHDDGQLYSYEFSLVDIAPVRTG